MIHLLLYAAAAFAGGTLTIEQAHQLAVGHAEVIAQSDANIEAAHAEYNKRLGALSPVLSLDATELIQDVPGGAGGTNTVQNTFVRRTRPEVKLGLKYTFFTGFREFAALKNAKATNRQRDAERDRAVQILFGDVSSAFYGILQREHEIEILTSRQKVLLERIAELRRFESLGRSRASERLSVEAEEKSLQADLELIRGELSTYESLLLFLTGLAQRPPLQDDREITPVPDLKTSIEASRQRPDLIAYREATVAMEQQVKFSKGEYWPTAEVGANYYAYRVGFYDQIDWDVQLALHFPFFQGGQTRAEVQKSKAQLRLVELDLQNAERQAALDVETKHKEIEAAYSRLSKLKEAAALHERNYELQSKEYRLGLVTNLEVLSALSDFYRTRRESEQALYRTKQLLAEFYIAEGKLPHTIQ